MALAVRTYTQTHKPPVAKKLCYTQNKIRAGARATDNELFCMDPFPPAAYADILNIGELAPDENLTSTDTSRSYMTSRTWTDGQDPTTPQYPFDAVKDNTPELWHYQLVYDKHNMVGMTSVTEDGVTYKKGYPTALWNTELLQFYFLDSTIQEMRQYYCVQALIDVPEGTWDAAATPPGVHPKCWGYLNVAVPGYKYTPMTLPSLPDTSAASQAVLTAAAPAATQASIIAKSVPAPMITVFWTNSTYTPTYSSALSNYAIGDELSDASITALGFDVTKKPVKKIDAERSYIAVISPTQTRTNTPTGYTGSTQVGGTTAQTTAAGTWESGGDSDFRSLKGRLDLATLLA
jgi:hypothetical protein